jgi:predicted alpha/beta-hydrolase family hydrolase
LRAAVQYLRQRVAGPIFLGGLSYGGRQASMLAAEDAEIAAALLLLSYPLHSPGKPEQMRTAHFPRLRVPAVFVHGTADPFGTIAEIKTALALIPAQTRLFPVDGAGHDLRRGRFDLAPALGALLDR